MLSIPQYLIESSFCLILFYSFYHFFLSKETFFQLNRVYLLMTPILSLGIPFLNISYRKEAVVEQTLEAVIYPAIQTAQEVQTVFWEQMDAPSPLFSLSVSDIIMAIYLLGVAIMAFTLFKSLFRLSRLIRKGKKQKQEGYTKVELEDAFPAASFFGYIFWNQDIIDEQKVILEHEKVHIRQWHSVDVLLMEFIVIIKWFNPLIYFFRNALKVTHEFIADQYMVEKKINVATYAHLLVHTNKLQAAPLTNTFYSMTKQRLKMLLRRPSKNRQVAKYLLVLPMIACLMSLFSFNLIEEIQPIQKGLDGINTTISELAVKTVVEMSPTEGNVDTETYKIHWGNYTFNCQAKMQGKRRQCNCERKFIAKADLKAINKSGIKFYKAGNKVDFKNVNVSTLDHVYCEKEDLMISADSQEKYNKKACIWNAFDENDIGRVSFQTDEFNRVYFSFSINSEKSNQTIPDNQLILGGETISLDSRRNPFSATITFGQIATLLDENTYTNYYGKRYSINNLTFSYYDGSMSTNYDLRKIEDRAFLESKIPADKELFLLPGFADKEEGLLNISLVVRTITTANSTPLNSFTWNKHTFSYRNPVLKMTKIAFLDLINNHTLKGPQGKPLLEASGISILNRYTPAAGCNSKGTWEEVIQGDCFQEQLKHIADGSSIEFHRLKASPVFVGGLTVYIEEGTNTAQTEIIVKQSTADNGTTKYKRHGYWHYQNAPFADLYQELTNSRYGQVKIEGKTLPNVDVFVRPSAKTTSDKVLKEHILTALKQQVSFAVKEKYTQKTDWFLSGGDAQKIANYTEENVTPNLEYFNEQILEKGLESVGPMDYKWFADRYFELEYGIKVIDLTEFSGRYILPLKTKNLKSLQRQLKKDFGLILKQETRTIPVTVVQVSGETQ